MSKIKPLPPIDQQNIFQRSQQRFAHGFERAIVKIYAPTLAFALRWRYATWALFLAVLIVMYAVVSSGNLRFLFFPRVQSETAHAILMMNPGTPFEVTDIHVRKITDSAEILREKYTDETGVSVITDIRTLSGTSGRTSDSNRGRVSFAIVPPEQRESSVTSAELVREWRKLIGDIPGAKDLNMRAEIFRGGAPVHLRLAGANIDDLNDASEEVLAHFGTYDGIFDITSSRGNGKQEIQIELTPAADTLGISLQQVAQQVRAAFFGQEAQRIQRGRDDVRVMVRFPEAKRRTLESIEQLKIRTTAGVEVAISEVATLSFSRGDDVISRNNRNRVIDITADANKETANIEGIKAGLIEFSADLHNRYPSIRASLEGEAAEQRDTFGSFFVGLIAVLFVIYGLLAIPFKSYSQPLIVMSVIPFGVIGALLGHMIVGIDLAIMSVTGMLALTGVVVNDSLVLVDYVNQQRAQGMPIDQAIRKAGSARFRAVILTSLTTFVGVFPLLLDKTTQAQILIPMATSLGFGVLFATTITLFLIPVNYLILNDIKLLMRGNPTATEQQS
jgi:multidrug efflux pump subunit AcrB